VQNEFRGGRVGKREMERRLQAEPMPLGEPSLAGHVAQTGELINVSDAYAIVGQRTVAFNKTIDETTDYATRSVFVVPLQDINGNIVGVLELLNALGEDGSVVPFDPGYEKLVRALASQAALAIRNARLEDLSFKDPLTDLFNRRYFALRLDELCRAHPGRPRAAPIPAGPGHGEPRRSGLPRRRGQRRGPHGPGRAGAHRGEIARPESRRTALSLSVDHGPLLRRALPRSRARARGAPARR